MKTNRANEPRAVDSGSPPCHLRQGLCRTGLLARSIVYLQMNHKIQMTKSQGRNLVILLCLTSAWAVATNALSERMRLDFAGRHYGFGLIAGVSSLVIALTSVPAYVRRISRSSGASLAVSLFSGLVTGLTCFASRVLAVGLLAPLKLGLMLSGLTICSVLIWFMCLRCCVRRLGQPG